MRLSVAVMAHPKRERFIPGLVGQLPGATVVWDRRNDRWDTGRRSMLAYDPAATHHLVVQDDALLCRDFLAGVHQALAAVPPECPVSFYTGRTRPYTTFVHNVVERAKAVGKSWLAMSGPWWGVAVAVPTMHIDAMVAWGDGRPDIANYDRRMSRYFETVPVECWYSIPSLVDHRTGRGNPSLVPGRGSTVMRDAHEFIGGRSPLTVDWRTEPVRPEDVKGERVPVIAYRSKRTGQVRHVEVGSSTHRFLEGLRAWERAGNPNTDPDPAPEPTAEAGEAETRDFLAGGRIPATTAPPKPYAAKKAWVDYAVTRGMGRDEAEALTRAQLVERYGA